MSAPKAPTVLVVEDDLAEATRLRLSLNDVTRWNVHTMSDCTAALSYLDGSEPYESRSRFPFPSLIVLDMHLPGHSGPRIMRWTRENEVASPLLVVILSKTSLVKVPGQIREKHGNVTICFTPYMTETDQNARAIHALFEEWRGNGKPKR